MFSKTREQILESMIEAQKPFCPHCQKEMTIWEVPPVNFSDGLGWGTPFLYVCFNDECPMFKEGWDNLQENYAQTASYRCICYPDAKGYECMPVFSSQGGRGQIIEEDFLKEQEMLKERIKRGFAMLADAYVIRDYAAVYNILIDATEPGRVRKKAAEMIGDIGEPDVIEPLRNRKFGEPLIQEEVVRAADKIQERFFLRECPFCAELIKLRANVCKHCGKEVAGQ